MLFSGRKTCVYTGTARAGFPLRNAPPSRQKIWMVTAIASQIEPFPWTDPNESGDVALEMARTVNNVEGTIVVEV